MSSFKRGDVCAMRVTAVDGDRTSWVCEGELVLCAECDNWQGGTALIDDWCPVVGKCTRSTDWCCWALKKSAPIGGKANERPPREVETERSI